MGLKAVKLRISITSWSDSIFTDFGQGLRGLLLACAQNVAILGTQKIKASFLSDTYRLYFKVKISTEVDRLFLSETDSLSKIDRIIWDHVLQIVTFFGPHA